MKPQYDDQLIESAWQEVESSIASVGMAEPKKGFVGRFQTHLAERKAEADRQQAWKILIVYASISLFLISMIGYLLVQNVSEPGDLLLIWAGLVSRVWTFFKMVLSIFSSFGRILPNMISVSGWVSVFSIGSGLVGFWMMMMRDYVNTSGVTA